MTIVINFLGGPGSGKSTAAYGLIALLKARQQNAELVQEFAKELTFRRDWASLANQDIVTREQDRRIRDLIGLVDFVVQDSALPLGICYAQGEFAEAEWFKRRVWELYDGYNNFTIFVRRKKVFEQSGRSQNEQQSRALDTKIFDLFGAARIDLIVDGDDKAPETAYGALMNFTGESQWLGDGLQIRS